MEGGFEAGSVKGLGPYLSLGVGKTNIMKKMKICLAMVLGVLNEMRVLEEELL